MSRVKTLEDIMRELDRVSGFLMMGQTLVSDDDLPHKVMAYIQEHYHEEITLDGLCRIFYCSRGKLTSSFRRTFQSSIHQYLMKYRLERSCILLNHAGCTIAEVARLSGFSEQNYFAKAFKKQYGMSPSDYRV